MATRRIVLAVLLAALGWFIVSKLSGPGEPVASSSAQENPSVPTAEVSEDIVDGRIAAQLYVAADLAYTMNIQFTPGESSSLSGATRPSVSLAMQDEHIDGIEPPLQLVANGEWRATGQLPKRGKWIVNVGIGDDFAEAEFQTQ